jgi:hypothetical protein
MKKLSDEDIQKLLDQGGPWNGAGHSAHEREEIKSYEFLFQELKKEPEGSLPYDFNTKVLSALEAKTSIKTDLRIYLVAILLLLLSLTGIYYLTSYLGHPLNWQVTHLVLPYKWILIFASILLFVVQYLDQKMVKRI